jgi:hypothetical protein
MKQLEVPEQYKQKIVEHFKHEKVSVSAVRRIVENLKKNEMLMPSVKPVNT